MLMDVWMVNEDAQFSNHIFEVLADWEHQLQHADIDFEELGL